MQMSMWTTMRKSVAKNALIWLKTALFAVCFDLTARAVFAQPAPDHFTIAVGDTVSDGVPALGAGNLEEPGAQDIYTFTATAGDLVYFEDLGAADCCLNWEVMDETGGVL